MKLPPQFSLKKLKYRLSDTFSRLYWRKISNADEVLFLGPWLGEVGPELQYWIPYLQQAKSRGFFGKKRIIAISRGGVEAWYTRVADEYVDVYDHLSPNEYRNIRLQIMKTTQKQVSIHPWERHFTEEVARKRQINSYSLIHPSMMWRIVVAWLQERLPLTRVLSQLRFQDLSISTSAYADFVNGLRLPKNFIVARFYTSHVFKAKRESVEVVKKILQKVSRLIPVVVFSMNYGLDDHGTFPLPKTRRIMHVGSLPIRLNMGIQTEVIRRSKGFIGTNGGLSVLPALVHIPVLSFYNVQLGEYVSLYSKHEAVTWILNEQLNEGRYAVVNLRAWEIFTDWFLQS